MLAGSSTELIVIILDVTGLGSFEEEIKLTLQIPLTNFSIIILSLERIIKSKKELNREKDKLVLPVLEDLLKTLIALKK